MNKVMVIGLTALLAAPAHATSLTEQFSSFFVVGDSLSDTQNTATLFAPPPLPLVPPQSLLQQPGVSSDGDTWAKQFVDEFGANGANLSFAAARARNNAPNDPVPDLDLQIAGPAKVTVPVQDVTGSVSLEERNLYSDGAGGLLSRLGDGSARELVAIFIGGNDFLDAAAPLGAQLGQLGAAQAAGDAEKVLEISTKISSDLSTLVAGTLTAVTTGLNVIKDAGVEDFIVMNLPNFAVIPQFNDPDPTLDAQLGALGGLLAKTAAEYNALLSAQLAVLRIGDPASLEDDINITEVDIFGVLSDTDRISAAGITNTDDACVFSEDPLTGSCSNYLFFDNIHPTAVGHSLVADLTREALNETYPSPVPLPAPALMLVSALGGLAALRRRKKAA